MHPSDVPPNSPPTDSPPNGGTPSRSTPRIATPHVLVLGASARAAAWSARRAGYYVSAADLFADRDLLELADATYRIPPHQYPRGFLPLLRQLTSGSRQPTQTVESPRPHSLPPITGLVLAGGMENHPKLVEQLNALVPVWGTVGTGLAAARDPFQLADVLEELELPRACVRRRPPPHQQMSTPSSTRWLKKPVRSAGGHGIEFVEPPVRRCQPVDIREKQSRRRCYYQEFVPGPSYSAAFIGCSGECHFLGTTRQWTNHDLEPTGLSMPHRFGYVGSVGCRDDQVRFPQTILDQWQVLGNAIARHFELRGLFGIDAVLTTSPTGQQSLVPVEVNPRYTASMEVIERLWNTRMMAWHVASCTVGKPHTDIVSQLANITTAPRACGKRIIFAPQPLELTGDVLHAIQSLCDDYTPGAVRLVDIPQSPTPISQGHPVFTVLASGDSCETVERTLGFSQPSSLLRRIMDALTRAT